MKELLADELLRSLIVAVLITGGLGTLTALTIWSIKGYLGLRTKVPRAKCGYMTMDDLQKHCDKHQSQCVSLIETKFNAGISLLEMRLKQGDKTFADHTQRLRDLELSFTGKVDDLGKLNDDLKTYLAGLSK